MSIGVRAFWGCTDLANAVIPDSVTSIGGGAFERTGLNSITIPDSVISIGAAAFYGCDGLTSVTIPDSVTSIGGGVFADCASLATVTIGSGVTEIAYSSFEGCTSLTNVTIPDSVTSIDYRAFYGCTSLTTATIGSGVTEIAYSSFYSCTSLTNVTIPDSVTSIEGAAFYGCTSLTSATIGSSVTSISWDVFSDCSALTQIVFGGGAASINSSAFSGVTATVYYPVDEESWTDDVMLDYGGTLTWTPYLRYPYIINECDIYSPIYTATTEEDLTVRVNGPFSKFVEVRVDGITIDPSCYEAYEGSTVVTLLSQYLDTLPRGQHTLTIVFSDGIAQGSFILTARSVLLLSGDGLTHVKNSGTTIAIRFDAEKSYLASVLVDGKAVSPSDYTVTTGSTIVTFPASYLDSLPVGSHTVTVNFGSYGTSSGTMHIAAASSADGTGSGSTDQSAVTIPNTGDPAATMLWACLVSLIALGLGTGLPAARKKKN